MNIAIFEPYSLATPHLETALELAERHLRLGDAVHLLGCNAALPTCDYNLSHEMDACFTCMAKRRIGIKLLTPGIRVHGIYHLKPGNRMELQSFSPPLTDWAALKQVRVENFEVGMATLSSLISYFREEAPSTERYQKLILRMMITALAVYRSVQNWIDHNHTDRLYVFNGRYAIMRAVLRACQSRGIECVCHERGSTFHRYSLTYNTLPHDLEYVRERVRTSWDRAPKETREDVAAGFFHRRASGEMPNWFSFTAEQAAGRLPEDWNAGVRNIAIFTSSDEEFAAIGDQWRNPLFSDQLEGLRYVVNLVNHHPGNAHLYIRLHPNLKGLATDVVRNTHELAGDRVTVIPAEANVSSYALLRSADVVVTFGSTMGIEATFWGKPSVLLGQSIYRDFGATYNPASREEIGGLLFSTLEPRDKAGALMHGYYFATFGEEFRFFQADGVFSGRFLGTRIEPRPIFSLLLRGLRRISRTRFAPILNPFRSASWLAAGLRFGRVIR